MEEDEVPTGNKFDVLVNNGVTESNEHQQIKDLFTNTSKIGSNNKEKVLSRKQVEDTFGISVHDSDKMNKKTQDNNQNHITKVNQANNNKEKYNTKQGAEDIEQKEKEK